MLRACSIKAREGAGDSSAIFVTKVSVLLSASTASISREETFGYILEKMEGLHVSLIRDPGIIEVGLALCLWTSTLFHICPLHEMRGISFDNKSVNLENPFVNCVNVIFP